MKTAQLGGNPLKILSGSFSLPFFKAWHKTRNTIILSSWILMHTQSEDINRSSLIKRTIRPGWNMKKPVRDTKVFTSHTCSNNHTEYAAISIKNVIERWQIRIWKKEENEADSWWNSRKKKTYFKCMSCTFFSAQICDTRVNTILFWLCIILNRFGSHIKKTENLNIKLLTLPFFGFVSRSRCAFKIPDCLISRPGDREIFSSPENDIKSV